VRPGRTVDLKVVTRSYRGEETLRTVPIDIPPNARGTLSLLVSDGAASLSGNSASGGKR